MVDTICRGENVWNGNASADTLGNSVKIGLKASRVRHHQEYLRSHSPKRLALTHLREMRHVNVFDGIGVIEHQSVRTNPDDASIFDHARIEGLIRVP